MSRLEKVRRRTGWKMTGLGVLSIGVALLMGAGVSGAAQLQPGEAAPGGLGGQAVPALATSSTYSVQNIPFAANANWTGSGTQTLSLSMSSVAATLNLSLYSLGIGYVTTSGTVLISTSLPVTVVGGSASPSVVVTGNVAFAQVGLYVHTGINTFSFPIVLPTLSGTVDVTPSPPGGTVFIAAAGMVGGSGPAALTPYPYPSYKYYGFAPIVGNGGSSTVFTDDFHDSDSGWVTGSSSICNYEYTDGHYRLTVKEPNDECVAWNPKIPAGATGTYKVSMRRTTGDDRVAVWAGMWFGQTTQDAFRNHYWVHLRLDHTDCSGEPSVLWFGAVVNDSSVMWRDKCNDDIRTDANDWNDLKIIRGNGRVKIYVNGTLERDDDDSYLPGPGWFDLVGVSNWSDTSSSNPVVIEFDNFSVTTAITP